MQAEEAKSMLKTKFKEEMQKRILSGELKPGDRLLSERELAVEYGISRGSVNQGILDLERMGFIRIVPRKGAFVADYVKKGTPQTLTAIMNYDSTYIDKKLFADLMEMRTLIEKESVRLAAEISKRESAANASSDRLQKLIELTELIGLYEPKVLAETLYQYHEEIVSLSDNAAYLLVFRSFEVMLKNMTLFHCRDKEDTEKSLPLYRQLTGAVLSGDSVKAQEYMCAILNGAASFLAEKM